MHRVLLELIKRTTISEPHASRRSRPASMNRKWLWCGEMGAPSTEGLSGSWYTARPNLSESNLGVGVGVGVGLWRAGRLWLGLGLGLG